MLGAGSGGVGRWPGLAKSVSVGRDVGRHVVLVEKGDGHDCGVELAGVENRAGRAQGSKVEVGGLLKGCVVGGCAAGLRGIRVFGGLTRLGSHEAGISRDGCVGGVS